ncbi:hypothetical protein Pan241w_53130 [Gimesia alba]|uniref:Uncharacterized protein n=1 Tax=Gimesia alba TaxID=2527973 RepID=A0A517RMV0_9PLAN|nr:hypothetical protein Pan241w_53130 [Gimesia alba]
MNSFGTGPTLREASPWLKDDAIRRARILEVTERNSVIEGLPPFTAETRSKIMQQLEAMSASEPQPKPAQ